MVVVGMASFPVGKYDSFGAKVSDDGSETQVVLPGGLHVGIRHSQGAAPLDGEQLGSLGGFFGSDLGRSARSHLSGGTVVNSGRVSTVLRLHLRASSSRYPAVGEAPGG